MFSSITIALSRMIPVPSASPLKAAIAKAERELGFRARPYVEGLRDAIEWFRAGRYLR